MTLFYIDVVIGALNAVIVMGVLNVTLLASLYVHNPVTKASEKMRR